MRPTVQYSSNFGVFKFGERLAQSAGYESVCEVHSARQGHEVYEYL